MANISDKPITKAQIKSIHVALSRQGIDDDTYRAKLDAMFGASSCKALSRRQASELLRALGYGLRSRAGKSPRPAAAPTAAQTTTTPAAGKLPSGVVALPSLGQRRFITDLVGEINWRVVGGYAHWLNKNMSLQRVATAAQAAQVIEGLKALKARQDKPK